MDRALKLSSIALAAANNEVATAATITMTVIISTVYAAVPDGGPVTTNVPTDVWVATAAMTMTNYACADVTILMANIAVASTAVMNFATGRA